MGKLLKKVENKDKNRKIVINFISKRFKKYRKKVLVVFDGTEESFLREGINFGGIKILFSKGIEADDKIINILKKSKNIIEEVVVTSDLELQKRAKSLGTQIKSVEEFINESLKNEKKEILPEKKIKPDNIDIKFWMDFFKKGE